MFIDTHVHLNDERLFNDVDRHIEEAIEANVQKMIVIGSDIPSSKRAIEIARKYPNVYAAIGIHPSEVKSANKVDLSFLEENIIDEKVVAIGEIGLDYYWDKSFNDLQKEYFRLQLELAKKYDKPVVVHSREAIMDTYEILHEMKVRGVMHCYSSSVEMAKKFTDMGMYIGIGGVVTFQNARVLKEVVKEVDLKYIVTETDAPYLAPVPFRGKLNKPKYIPLIASQISQIKNIDIGDVSKQIEKNVKDLFNI